MKKIIVAAMAAGLAASVATAEVGVTLDFASAYVFRGVTLNDGAVFQPGIEASGFEIPEEYGSLAFGAWGNYDIDDYGGNVGSSTFQETDWYFSYGLPTLVEGLDLSVGYCEYSYGSGASDEEISLGAGTEIAGIGLGLTFFQGVGGFIGTQSYIEATAGYGLDLSEELSASIDASAAFLDPDDSATTESGFHNYSIGAGLSYAISDAWSAGLSGAYIGQGDDDVLVDEDLAGTGTFGYDVEFVGMFSLACEM